MQPNLITSAHNQRVKDAAKLRTRRQRDRQGRIIIDGARELLRAMAAGVEIVEAFVCGERVETPEAREAVGQLQSTAATLWHATPQVFEKLAFGQRVEGVLAVARQPRRNLAALTLSGTPLVAVLEGIEKPGNVGAVLRSADAAGVAAVVVANAGTDLFNPNCIRASLGTVFTLPVCAASTSETIEWLRARRLRIFAARVDARLRYDQADFRGPAAIVLGGEASGLTDVWNAADVQATGIPMHGAADSLNVSAAAAVLFYEALRQRAAGA